MSQPSNFSFSCRTKLRLLLVSLFSLILSGCSSVTSTVTSFHKLDPLNLGSIRVVAEDASIQNSLEFEHYRHKLDQLLTREGFRVVQQDQSNTINIDHVAKLSYEVDNGKIEQTHRPIMGYRLDYVGFGSPYYSHHMGHHYDLVDVHTTTQTWYTRTVKLQILPNTGSAEATSAVKPVYEGTAKSRGRCNSLAPVFDEMLDALFTDFPGESGEARRITIESEDDSC